MDETEDYLKSRRTDLKKRRRKTQQSFYIAIYISLTLIVITPIFTWSTGLSSTFSAMLLAYLIIPIGMLPILRGRIRDLEQDIKEVEFEIDLQQFELSQIETKSEKILRLNDTQLQRYYNLNLSQNAWVFIVGLLCILLGLFVIAATLYVVINLAETLDTKIITAILGGVGTFLTSYIAAIFLKMHSSATQHLGSFHSRLVDTHQILLASLVASRIEDKNIREKTMSELALKVANNDNKS